MRIVKPYMLWQYPKMERWLQAMAREGWRLERVNGWAFHFRKTEPRDVRFRFMYEEPRAGRLLQTKLELQHLHGECIRTGLFDPDIMRMTPEAAAIRKYFKARREEHLRHFGAHALVMLLFSIIFVSIFLLSEGTMNGDAIFMLLMTIAASCAVIQYLPAFIMEWRSKP